MVHMLVLDEQLHRIAFRILPTQPIISSLSKVCRIIHTQRSPSGSL